MTSPLKRNFEVLTRHQPELVQLLLTIPPSPHLQIVTARSGCPVILKKGRSLHSRIDPAAEAEAFADGPEVGSFPDPETLPLVFGLGSGYHLLALSRYFSEMVVFEPDPAVVRAALESVDLSHLLPQLTIITNETDLTPDMVHRHRLLVHRPTQRLEPEAFNRLQAALRGQDKQVPPTGAAWKIIVVTPIYGGSLPVARHTLQALEALGHEVIEADMSPLDAYYQKIRVTQAAEEKKDQALSRLISLAGEYVAFLAESERPHLVLALAQAPLNRDFLARIRAGGVLTAFWFVEDYRLMSYFRELATAYDFFFHIQGLELEKELARLGAPRALYLPLAADTQVFRPIDNPEVLAPYRTDLSFMGSGYPNRRCVFTELLDYELRIWGTEWDLNSPLGPKVQDRGRRVPTEETVLIYNAARINLNLHSSVFSSALDPSGGFINPRTFEIAACGAFQLVDRRYPLELHFTPDEEMTVFESVLDLRNKINFFLKHPQLRQEIADKARQRVLAEHTYQHRMRLMLDFIGAAFG